MLKNPSTPLRPVGMLAPLLSLLLSHTSFASSTIRRAIMTVTITLITADDPPKLLIHSRAILAAHSTVFRDLFSLPISSTVQAESTGAAPSNNIAESEAEIAPFLSILTGELGGEFVLSDEQWFSVARLADKYDSLVARVFVENMARCVFRIAAIQLQLTPP